MKYAKFGRTRAKGLTPTLKPNKHGQKGKKSGEKKGKGEGGYTKNFGFRGGPATQIGGYNPHSEIIYPSENIAYICSIMIKKFNIVSSHISYGNTQESPSYEMGISKYAQMRKDRMKEQKIEMMSEAYKRAERSEDENEMSIIMPIIKRG